MKAKYQENVFHCAPQYGFHEVENYYNIAPYTCQYLRSNLTDSVALLPFKIDTNIPFYSSNTYAIKIVVVGFMNF